MASTPGRKQAARRNKTPDENGLVTYVRYSKVVCERICRRIAEGEMWSKMANDADMPAYATLYDWLRKHPDFREDYEMAREMAADRRAEKALEVAEATTPSTVSADRLKVSALQWYAAKGNPRRYGRKAEDKPATTRVIIEIREFEKYVGEDGKTYVREVLPEPRRKRGRG